MSKLQVKNEAVIDAPIASIWSVITDISVLHKVNPGIIRATGRMDTQGELRTCEIDNKGKKGTMTERLIEMVHEKKTVWTIENDDMGFGKILKDTRFVFNLEKIGDSQTRVTSETYFTPSNFIAGILSVLVIKKNIRKAQYQILNNLKNLAEMRNL